MSSTHTPGLTHVYMAGCPFAHRSWITLLETGVPFEAKPVSLTDKPAWFTELYHKALGADLASNGKVPILVDGDFILSESAVVAEYVALKYGGASKLNPVNLSPEERARATIFTEQVTGKVIKYFYQMFSDKDAEARAATIQAMLTSLRALSAQVERTPGPYLLGDELTLCDVLVFPWIARFGTLKHFRGFEVPNTPEYAGYHAFVSAMRARPSLAASIQPDEYYIDVYSPYAEGKK